MSNINSEIRLVVKRRSTNNTSMRILRHFRTRELLEINIASKESSPLKSDCYIYKLKYFKNLIIECSKHQRYSLFFISFSFYIN